MPFFDHFGFIAPWYDRLISNRNVEKIIELAKLPATGHLLDMGGGTGRVATSFVGLMDQIEVVDLSIGMLRMAWRKDLRSICASGVLLPFQNNFFSRILVVDSLHHF